MKERTAQADWLRVLIHCHDALTAYGEHRLESSGWRELGIGSLPAASEGFRSLALGIATGWATYEARDTWDQTITDIALRQPHWFSPQFHASIATLAESRLDLYVVEADGSPVTVLRRVRDDRRLRVVCGADRVTPAGATLVARVASSEGRHVLLSSAVLAPERAVAAVHGGVPEDLSRWSTQLLEALLRQFAAADLDGRGTSREPRLTEIPLRTLARLHRTLRSLEVALDQRGGHTARHRTVDGGEMLAEKRGRHWRVVMSGARPAALERVPCGASHAVDVEIMRQIGATSRDGVLWLEGSVEDLAGICASAAVARSRRVA